MPIDGESLHVDERLVVSPAAGVFSPVDPLPAEVEVGTTLGFVAAGDAAVPVGSALRGRIVAVDAVAGERLVPYQRVAWLRT